MADDWWPLKWIPADAEYTPTSIDWPTAEVTHNGKTVWVDQFDGGPNTDFCYFVGLRRTPENSPDQISLPRCELTLRCFLQEYFKHADKDEWPSDFWERMQERLDAV